MIFFFQQGRLGNQLFQYAYLRKCFPSKIIIMLGCSQLKKFVINDKKIIFVPMTKPESFLNQFFKLIIIILSKIKLIRFIKEKTDKKLIIANKSSSFHIQGFFQYGNLIKANSSKIVFNSVKKFLYSSLIENPHKSCFVHIRRADYLIWPSLSNPAVLDDNYYIKSIYFMIEKFRIKNFYIISDDIKYCKLFLKNIPNVRFVSQNVTDDLLLMGSIKFGILSSSSLSWWGSYLSNTKFKSGFYIAPKYWAGHRQKRWYPKFIKSNIHQYINDYY